MPGVIRSLVVKYKVGSSLVMERENLPNSTNPPTSKRKIVFGVGLCAVLTILLLIVVVVVTSLIVYNSKEQEYVKNALDGVSFDYGGNRTNPGYEITITRSGLDYVSKART